MVPGMRESLLKLKWIKAGLAALYDDGPDGLRVEKLCDRMGVTKGSFYHHFTNLADYKIQLLEYWERESTSEIIRRASGEATPQEQLLAMRHLTSTIPRSSEKAIRSWALHDPIAGRYQKKMDRERLKALEQIYGQIYETAEAESLAKLVCCLFVGAEQIMIPITKKELKELYEFMIDRGRGRKQS